MSVAAVVKHALLVLRVAAVAAAAPGIALAQGTPMPGSPGIGDSVYPLAGNGGYAVDRYDVALAWEPETGIVNGDVTIRITVTQPLSTFDLDYSGPEIATVTVAGRQASWIRQDRELKVEVPVSDGLRIGQEVDIRVVYRGVPATLSHPVLGAVGWLPLADGAVAASMPDAARAWMPVNGHPSDRAVFAFRLTAPEPYVAVAAGLPGETEARNGGRIFVFETAEPIRPAAAYVAFGRLRTDEPATTGRPRLRLAIDEALDEDEVADLEALGAMISSLAVFFGPFPFDEIGIVALDSEAGADHSGAFGAQAWPVLSPAMLADDAVLAHVIARQWWGSSVTPETWNDLWLQEGLATYAELLWLQVDEGPDAAAVLLRQWDEAVRREEGLPTESGTPAMLFDRTAGLRGALAAHALRRELGDGLFFRVLQTFAERFGHDVASVGSFVAVAEEVSGADLDSWAADWLSPGALPALP